MLIIISRSHKRRSTPGSWTTSLTRPAKDCCIHPFEQQRSLFLGAFSLRITFTARALKVITMPEPPSTSSSLLPSFYGAPCPSSKRNSREMGTSSIVRRSQYDRVGVYRQAEIDHTHLRTRTQGRLDAMMTSGLQIRVHFHECRPAPPAVLSGKYIYLFLQRVFGLAILTTILIFKHRPGRI